MGTTEIVLRLLAGVLLILANAFFVCIEFALTRLRQFNKNEIPNTPGAQKCWELTEELEINLTGCQVGISLTSILLGVIAEPAMTQALEPLFALFGADGEEFKWVGVVVSIALLNLIHKIWGEQSPTYLGVERPLQCCSALGVPFSWWCKLAYPVILFGDGLAKWTLSLFGVTVERSWTKEDESPRLELREALVELMKDEGVSKDRRNEVVSALDIGNLPVSEIMVPRNQIVALSTEKSLEENLTRIQSHSRFPLIGNGLDEYQGGIYVPELVAHLDRLRSGTETLTDLCHGRLTLPSDLVVSKAIDKFQEERQEIALVVDQNARTVGLCTLTDCFEAIVGEAKDPLD